MCFDVSRIKHILTQQQAWHNEIFFEKLACSWQSVHILARAINPEAWSSIREKQPTILSNVVECKDSRSGTVARHVDSDVAQNGRNLLLKCAKRRRILTTSNGINNDVVVWL